MTMMEQAAKRFISNKREREEGAVGGKKKGGEEKGREKGGMLGHNYKQNAEKLA